jgi:hypothetical protein
MIASIVILLYILYMVITYDKMLITSAIENKREYNDRLVFIGLAISIIIGILLQIKLS